MFQHRMLRHPLFMTLSPNACKVLLFLAAQYTGSNNGDLGIAWKIARLKGFTSNGTLKAAARELVAKGFLVQTRQGGRNRCSLFALAWFAIDHCDGKLDVPPSAVATNAWLKINLSEPRVVQLEPRVVQSARTSTGKASH